MLRKPAPQQTALEMVSLDGLVPKDHLLRKIEAVIDFSFIHDRVAGLYCPDNGRPPLDPTLMFKALFIGYLFGVRSERQLVREIEVNVAYRWFLGLKLTDPVFDASTLSQNRRRRYNDTTVAQDIFDAIVEQAMAKGLVDGTVLYTDSTHLKANANTPRWLSRTVSISFRIARWHPGKKENHWITVSPSGVVCVAETFWNGIRKIEGGIVSTLASRKDGNVDGPLSTALFSGPSGTVSDQAGNLYLVDQANHRIRKIDTSGNVTTVAGPSGPEHAHKLAGLETPDAEGVKATVRGIRRTFGGAKSKKAPAVAAKMLGMVAIALQPHTADMIKSRSGRHPSDAQRTGSSAAWACRSALLAAACDRSATGRAGRCRHARSGRPASLSPPSAPSAWKSGVPSSRAITPRRRSGMSRLDAARSVNDGCEAVRPVMAVAGEAADGRASRRTINR